MLKAMSTNLYAVTIGSAALLATTGCSDGSDKSGGVTGATEAVLVAERFNTPDGRAAYMGAFPGLPSSDVDISQMVELGPEGDVFACGGNAFFYNPDAGTITKYELGEDLSLSQGAAIDVVQEGITGWTGAHICASGTKAFIVNGTGGRIVEWNPETMTIVEGFDVPTPDIADGLELQFFEPKVAGNLVYFSLAAINWDTLDTANRAMLAVFDVSDRTLSLDYDERCQASLGGFVDSEGNYYQLPEDGGFFSTYSPTPELPSDCVLRVKAGEKKFDDDYVQYLEDGQSLRAMWPVDDQHTLAATIAISGAPSPENMWDWYSLPIEPVLFNVNTGEQEPYDSVPKVQPMNSRKLVLDGKSYYQVYSFDEEGLVTKIQLVELTREGAEPAFTLIGGDILTLERLY